MEQEAYSICYVITKWNYYLHGSEIVSHNDHKPLQKFLNDKNVNNKINRCSLELATYNTTFEWISGACKKATDCLLLLVDIKHTPATTQLLLTCYLHLPQMVLPSAGTAKHVTQPIHTTYICYNYINHRQSECTSTSHGIYDKVCTS